MAEVFQRLCSSEFVCLKKNFTVERDLMVETFAVRVRRPVAAEVAKCCQVALREK